VIRTALPDDVGAMVEIYNEAILDAVNANCDVTQHDTGKFRALYFEGDPRHAVLVKETDAGRVLAWGALKSFSARPHDRAIAEVAVYVRREQRSQGLGIRMMHALMRRAGELGFASLVAIVLGRNVPSLRGAAACGFAELVRIPSIAVTGGHAQDIVWMQKILDEGVKP
jgi:phosphinothricin acetyltransferase